MRAKHIGRDIAASFKNIVGGELKGYTELLEDARSNDISFACAMDFIQAVKLEMPFDLPNLAAYRSRLAERPSFQAAR